MCSCSTQSLPFDWLNTKKSHQQIENRLAGICFAWPNAICICATNNSFCVRPTHTHARARMSRFRWRIFSAFVVPLARRLLWVLCTNWNYHDYPPLMACCLFATRSPRHTRALQLTGLGWFNCSLHTLFRYYAQTKSRTARVIDTHTPEADSGPHYTLQLTRMFVSRVCRTRCSSCSFALCVGANIVWEVSLLNESPYE